MEVTIDGKKYVQKWVPVEEPEEESKKDPAEAPHAQQVNFEEEIKKLREDLAAVTKQMQKKNRKQEQNPGDSGALDVNSILESIANGGKKSGGK